MELPLKRLRSNPLSEGSREDDEEEGFVRFQVTVGSDDEGRDEKRNFKRREDSQERGHRSQRQPFRGSKDREEYGPSTAPNGPPRQHRGPYSIKSFPFDSMGDDQGIIFHLGSNKKTGAWTNPVHTRKLRVCASSLAGGTLASTVERDELFQSEDLPYSWVLFDFQECAVRPSRYTLVHQSDAGSGYMRSWQLEGSNDNNTWQVLSRHNNDSTLGSQRPAGSWELKTNTFFRYIRIVLDPHGNSKGGSALMFHGYDVYGDLQVPSKAANPSVLQPPSVSANSPASLTPFNQSPDPPLLAPIGALASVAAFPQQLIGGLPVAVVQPQVPDLSALMFMPQMGLGIPQIGFGRATRNLEELRGQILQHCFNKDESVLIKDRLGSPDCSMHEKQLVLDEVIHNLVAIMNHRYGTYVVQALLEFSVPMHRKRLAAAIQTQLPLILTGPFSCFALLRAMDFLGQDDVFLLGQEIRVLLPELATQKIPSLVVAKLFEALPPTHSVFLVQAMRGAYQAIASTPHGTRVIHKILLAFKEHASAILPMAEELLPCTLALAQSPFGKDLVAALLRFGMTNHRKAIISVLLMDWNELMQHPIACFCCKAAWDNADRLDKENIVRAMINDPSGASALEVLYNPNSAGVLERVLGTDNPQLRLAVLEFYGPHAPVVAGVPDRRKLLALLEGKAPSVVQAGQKEPGSRGQGRKKAGPDGNKRPFQSL